MTKKELVAKMAKETGLAPTKAKLVLESILTNIAAQLKQNRRVSLPRFGSWNVFIRNSRVVRHPLTGKIQRVDSKNFVKFKASERLTYVLNDSAKYKALS